MIKISYARSFVLLFLCVIMVFSLPSCITEEEKNNVQRDLSNYGFKFDLPGVTGQILKMEFCNLNAKNEEDSYVNIEVEWSDFYNFNRKKRHEAELYYLGFTQNDQTSYKLIVPSSKEQKNMEVKLNETKLLPSENISVDLFKINRGKYPLREFVIHLFNIPAE